MQIYEVPPSPTLGSKPVSLIFRLCATLLAAASGIVMAASSECAAPSSGDATFTYARFGSFVFLVWSTIGAAILEVVAVYLQLRITGHPTASAAADDYKPVTGKQYQENEGISAAMIVLVLVDLLVHGLLFTAIIGGAYMAAHIYGEEIGACARFAGQVEQANILCLAAGVAVIAAVLFRPSLK